MSKHSRIKNFFKKVSRDINCQPECKARIPEEVLVSIKFTDGHIHHHHPSKEITKELIKDLSATIGLSDLGHAYNSSNKKIEMRPVIFKNRQAIGDILMMTCAIRDLKSSFPDWPVNVSTTAMNLWRNNPYLDRSLTEANADVIQIGPGALTNASNRDDRHFANAFRLSIEEKLGISIKQGPIKPDIWMSKDEIETPIIQPPYWIIVAGEKGDWTAKTYPFKRWQEFVSIFPEITFVQIGAKEHKHPNLTGKNVINLIGKTQDKKTGIRDLFNLFYFAEGSIGLVSFHMHLAAAFNLPSVVIAGAREPARFTRYPGQQYLCTDGCLPCAESSACWHCDLEKTCPSIVESEGQKYPKCVDIILLEDVVRAFTQYYDGGRLSLDHPRKPSLPNSLAIEAMEIPMVKANLIPKKDLHEFKEKEDFVNPEDYGFTWGGASITVRDWDFLLKVLKDFKIKTVLEFGPGLSSFLMSDRGISVTAFESEMRYLKELQVKGLDQRDNVLLLPWNKQIIPGNLPKFNLAIVDGPPGGESREFSTKIASEHADLVLIHDAGRVPERKWQEKYLKENFEGPRKGGHRYHFWKRKSSTKVSPEILEDIAAVKEAIASATRPSIEARILNNTIVPGKKLLRVVFNGRGEGGAERSTTWIMNRFIEKGWHVEYVCPQGAASGTFRKHGSPKVTVTPGLSALRHPCDVLLLYTNDWVWDFSKEDVIGAFEEVNAGRKVMAINYRLGKIGQIPWTHGWDKYIFLNSSLQNNFEVQYMEAHGFDKPYSFSPMTLPPPTDLTEYFGTVPDYEGEMRIVRHSSQGDAKYAKDINEKIKKILEVFPKATIRLMPAPSFLDDFGERVIRHPKNSPSVKEFLSLGNVFWYDLPDGYHDMGPKVIMEAQASGLPVIANNHSGPKDRVVDGTGFLYNDFEQAFPAFEALNKPHYRKEYGINAKKHAKKEYDSELWINNIIGEEEK